MKEIAKLYGVSLFEDFELVNNSGMKMALGPYRLTMSGLVNRYNKPCTLMFVDLIVGNVRIN